MNAPSEIIRIAIVEDNRFIRAGWESTLAAVPEFRITGIFSSSEEVIGSSAIAETDVIIMDIGLGGMSGIEAVQILLQDNPKLSIVMCSVFEDDANVFNALAAGAVGYLVKRAKPAELIEAVREAATGGSPMTPSIARKVIDTFRKQPPISSGVEAELTPQDITILEHLALGKSYATIAREVFLSIDGLRYHIRKIYDKLHVHSRGEAIAQGLKQRIISPPR